MKLKVMMLSIVLLLLCLSSVVQAESFYVANGGDNSIKLVTTTRTVTTYASGLSTPKGLALGEDRSLYVVCDGDKTIRKVAPGGGTVTTFASGLGSGYSLSGAAYLGGFLYVSATNNTSVTNSVVFRFAPDGTQSVFAVTTAPGGLAFDNYGNLFAAVSVSPGGGVNRIDPGGNVSSFASGLMNPIGLARSQTGSLYAAEFFSPDGNPKIKRIDPGGAVYTYSSSAGTPYGLAFDNAQRLYAADFDSGVINRISPTGVAIPVASGLSSPRFMIRAPEVVPEPSALLSLVSGTFGLMALRRRRSR